MPKLCSKELCTGCMACVNICPQHAISKIEDEYGFLNPFVDTSKCTECHLCEQRCPILKNVPRVNFLSPTSICAWNIDEKIRLQSSSGGAFSALASYVIKEDGVVYGATWEKELTVSHIRVTSIGELEKLRKSKYLPSDVGTSYQQVKIDLQNGRIVLFSGTPCQVAGLKSFLNRDYEKLYTIDFICHGVPSPLIFREYISYLEDKVHDKIDEVNFRDKSLGVETNLIICAKLHSKQRIKKFVGKDISFYRGFVNSLYLREGCYNCRFNSLPRLADVSLADYRGLATKAEFRNLQDRPKGFTGCLINSHKGKRLIECSDLQFEIRPIDELCSHQPHLYHPAAKPLQYSVLFSEMKRYGYKYIANKYMPFTFIKRVDLFLRMFLKPSGYYTLGRFINKIKK